MFGRVELYWLIDSTGKRSSFKSSPSSPSACLFKRVTRDCEDAIERPRFDPLKDSPLGGRFAISSNCIASYFYNLACWTAVTFECFEDFWVSWTDFSDIG